MRFACEDKQEDRGSCPEHQIIDPDDNDPELSDPGSLSSLSDGLSIFSEQSSAGKYAGDEECPRNRPQNPGSDYSVF